MHRRTQRWLYGGIAFVLVIAGIAAFVVRPRTDRRSVVSARQQRAARDDAPQPAEAEPEDASGEANEATAPSNEAGEESQKEAEPALETVAEGDQTEPQAPADSETLDEERFVEVAAKIRLWQQTIADTPEGRRMLEDLVRKLLNRERLTPSDLEAFGKRIGPEALDRLDARINQRVAELGQTRYRVEAKPTKGTRIIAQGQPDGGKGEKEP